MCSEWFEKPKRKYDIVQRFENIVPQLLPEVGERVEEAIETKAISDTAANFDKFYFPEYLSAKKILEATEAFKTSSKDDLKRFEISKTRERMLKSFV